MKALDGVKILDLTQILAGPFCTQLLSDHGADVVKMEPVGGDQSRRIGLKPGIEEGMNGTYSPYFESINRNKRSIVVDLRQESGKDIVRRMVGQIDVLVENFRVGVMDRLGLGYEELSKINPKLVYATIRGFGDPRSGESPYVNWPSYDIIAQSTGGILSITGHPDEPMKIGPGIGDTLPGIYLAFGIVSALRHAERTGKGQFVDVCMSDAILTITERIIYQYQTDGVSPKSEGNFHPFFCPYGLYRASDGWVAIGCISSDFWAKLTRIMGCPELGLRDDLKNDALRGAQRDFVNKTVESWTMRHTKKEITAALGGIVPMGPVNTAEDILRDPHFRSRNMLVEVEKMGRHEEKTLLVNTAVKLAASPGGVSHRAPYLGEHTRVLLAEFGFEADEIAELTRQKVVIANQAPRD